MRHKKQLETLSMEEFNTGFERWQEFWHGYLTNYRSYYDFLGINVPPPNQQYFKAMHHIARKVRLLNSPHHHAFLMAYKLRKGHKK